MTAHGVVTVAMAAVAVAGALMAVGFRNIFHNILGFALAMLGVAGVFLSLGADFVAAVFILVYVGAVAIAMVYAVMLSLPLDQPSLQLEARAIGHLTEATTLRLHVFGDLRQRVIGVFIQGGRARLVVQRVLGATHLNLLSSRLQLADAAKRIR